MRYEIRQIDPKEMRRTAVYFANEIEIKTDDYGSYVDDKQIGKKVGFKIEGKSRKKWVHTVRTMAQIIDHKTGEITTLKSNEQLLREMGRDDLADKWFA